MSPSDKPHDPAAELVDATDDELDASDTVVPTHHGRRNRGFWLEYRGHKLDLRPGSLLIGRSGACQLVLEDNLVSRRHAVLVVKADGVKLKDLSSANGVYVNGVRIEESVQLKPGDRVVIGQEEMTFRESSSPGMTSQQAKYLAETLHGTDTAPFQRGGSAYPDESEMTAQGQALELLGGVADKVLVLGRGDEAERILGSCLAGVLTKTRQNGTVEDDIAEKAASYAIKLAIATGKGRWAEYAFELYTVLRRPLPSLMVDQLYKVLRNLQATNVTVLREYVAVLHAAQGRFGPTERFLAHRIEGLERLLR